MGPRRRSALSQRPRPPPTRLPLLAATAAAAAHLVLRPNLAISHRHCRADAASASSATTSFAHTSTPHVVPPELRYHRRRRPLPPSSRRSTLSISPRPPPPTLCDPPRRGDGFWKGTSCGVPGAGGYSSPLGWRSAAALPTSSSGSRWVDTPLRLAASATDDDLTPSHGGGLGVDVDGNGSIVQGDGGDGRMRGILVLLTVPLAWGTFEPAVRYVYNEVDPPVPALLFTVGYYAVAALALCSLAWQSSPPDGDGDGERRGKAATGGEAGGPGYLVAVADTRQGSEGVNDSEEDGDEDRAPSTQRQPLPSVGYVPDTGSSMDGGEGAEEGEVEVRVHDDEGLPIRGGVELGTYLFLGNGLQVVGLKTVPSDRAAFLLQLTTIMVPLVQAASSGRLSAVPARTWIACLIALTGVAVMGLDGPQQPGAVVMKHDGGSVDSPWALWDGVLDRIGDIHVSHGDLLIVLAALSYTFHCVRLGEYARRTTPVRLAACKAVTETSLSAVLLLFVLYIGGNKSGLDVGFSGALSGIVAQATEANAEISAFVGSVAGTTAGNTPGSLILLPTLGAVAWTGLVTIAYTIYAQSYGQRIVAASDANLIYTVQPLFTALFAWALLGETLGVAGYTGAALIASAVAFVATTEEVKDETESSPGVALTEGAPVHLKTKEPAMQIGSKGREG